MSAFVQPEPSAGGHGPSALGQWKLQVDTPIGPKATRLGLEQTADGVRGWMVDLFGKRIATTQADIDGHRVTWRLDITVPVPLAIFFTGTVTEHGMSGTADCAVATMTFVGVRDDAERSG